MGASVQPQSPWILYFDGATSHTGGKPSGIGAVLKDSRGHTVVELKKVINSGESSTVAKYEALVAGLKKALSLGVEYMLVKGDSRLVHCQVVGQCSVDDDQLLEYHRQVMALSKDFRALFVERISKVDNIRADRLANDAIDEELQGACLSAFIHHRYCPHSHPLPLQTSHIKESPMAPKSPPVAKRHVGLECANQVGTRSSDGSPSRRCRHFCNDEDSFLMEKVVKMRNHSQHGEDSARSTRPGRQRVCGNRPSKRQGISAALLQHWDCLEETTDTLTFSTDESSEASDEINLEQVSRTDARFTSISSSSKETSSGDEVSEADYERLVKTLVRDSSKEIRGTRQWR